MEILVLSFFDVIEGPRVFLRAPTDGEEDVIEQIPSLLNLYTEGFFVNISAEYKSANLIFELPSDFARGKYEILMISLVVDINSNINVNLSEDILQEFVDELKQIEDAFKAFYVNSTKFIGDPEKLIVIEDTFQKFYTRSERTLRAIEKAEIRYRHLFEHSPFSITLVSMNGIILDTNPANEKLFGYSTEDLIGKDFREFLTFEREKLPMFVKAYKDILKGEQTKPIEVQITKKDGNLVWVNITYSLIDIGEEKVIMVITQEIDKSKKAEQELKESEEKFRKIAEHDLLGIAIMQDNRLKYYNETWAKIFGYTMEELKDWGDGEFINAVHPDDKKLVMQQALYKQTGSPKALPNYIFRAFKKTGETIWIENYGKTMTYRGRPANLAVIFDATARKNSADMLKESEEKYRVTVDSLSDPLHVIDKDMNIVLGNKALVDTLDRLNLDTDITGKSIIHSFPFVSDEVYEEYQQVFEEKKPHISIDRVSVNNSDFITETRKIPITDGEEVTQVISIMRDITEQKLSEDKLKESEEKFRKLSIAAKDGIIISDEYHNIKFSNNAAEKIFGLTSEETIGKNVYKTFMSEKFHKLADIDDPKFRAKGKGLLIDKSFEVMGKRKDGTQIPLELSTSSVKIKDKWNSIAIIRDMTEKKKSENKLKESERKFRHLFENSPYSIWLIDKEGRVIETNPPTQRFLSNIQRDELIGLKITEILAKNVHNEKLVPVFEKFFNSIIEAGSQDPIEFEMIRGDLKKFWLKLEASFVDTKNKGLIQLIIQDITEEKESKQKLMESEEKYRITVDSLSDPLHVIDKDLNIILGNKALEKRLSELGINEPYLNCKLEDTFSFLPREVIDEYKQIFDIKEQIITIDALNLNGIDYYTETRKIPIMEEDNVSQIMTLMRDITDLKRSEEKLKESEEKYRFIAENANDLIAILNNKITFEYFNIETHNKILGYSEEDLAGKNLLQFMHPDDMKTTKSFIKEGINKGVAQGDFRVRKKDGNYVWIQFIGRLTSPNFEDLKVIIIGRDITDLKLSEEKLKESEEKYRFIAENANDLISILDSKFKMEYFNRETHERILGYPGEELEGTNLLQFLHPDDLKSTADYIRKGIMKGEGVGEFRIRKKDGSYIWFQSKGRITSPNFEDLKVIIIGRDITERKLAEQEIKESEEKFRIIAENSLVGISMFQEDKLIYFNQRFADIHGYPSEELKDWRLRRFAKVLYNDDRAYFFEKLNTQIIMKETDLSFQHRIVNKNGIIKWIDRTSTFFTFKGKHTMLTLTKDITFEKEAEKLLKTSEEKFRNLINNVSDAMVEVKVDGRYTYLSPQTLNLTGYHPEELLGQPLYKLVHPDDFIRLVKNIKEAYTTRGILTFEYRIKHKEGHYIYVSTRGSFVEDINGEKFVGVVRDISESKKFEDKIRESEEKYRNLAETSPNPIILLDYNGYVVDCNVKSEKLLNLTQEQMLGKSVLDLYNIPENKVQWLKEMFKRIRQGEIDYPLAIEHIGKDSESNWIETYHSLVEIGEKTFIQTVIQDITIRKNAVEQLRDSELKYRHLFETTPYAIALIDMEGKFVDSNANIEKFFGFKKNDYKGKEFIDTLKTITDQEKTIIEKLLDGKSPEPYELRIIRKDGELLWISMQASLVQGPNGTLVQLVMQNIHEMKEAQQQLEHSEERYRIVSEQSLMGVVIIQDGELVYVNQLLRGIFGPPESISQESKVREFFKLIHPDDQQKALNQFMLLNEGGDINLTGYQYRLLNKEGDIKWFEIYSRSLLYQGKKTILVTLVDVSEKKQAEQQLLESEEKHRLITDNLNDMICIVNNRARFEYINEDVVYKLTGHSNEIIGTSSLKLIHPDDVESALRSLRYATKEGEAKNTIRMFKKNGEIIWMDIHGKAFKDKDGTIKGLLIGRDISENRVIEEKIIESEEKYRLLAKNIKDIIWTTDLKFNTTYVSPSVTNILGYTVEEDIALPLNKKFVPDSVKKLAELIKEQIKPQNLNRKDHNPVIKEEFEQFHKDGSIIPTEVTMSALRNDEGIALGIVGITRDISDRKKTERRLSESEEKYRLITENADDVICVVDRNYKFTYVNEGAITSLGGYTRGDLIGKEIKNFIHPEDIHIAVDQLIKGFERGPGEEGLSELRLKTKDGNWIWFEINGKMFKNKDGNTEGLVICRNITERKNAEWGLKVSDQKYRDIIKKFDEILSSDINGVLNSINSTCQLFDNYKEKPEKLNELHESVKVQINKGLKLISEAQKIAQVEIR